nr:FkbM family methyltransferase [Thiorhodococcus mannitoliphagus]
MDLISEVPHSDAASLNAIRDSGLPVVQWGAGELSWYIWNYLTQNGIFPVALCDSNPDRHGSTYLGLPVLSYVDMKEQLTREKGGYHIVVSTGPKYKEEIFSFLERSGEKNRVWYFRGYEVCGEKFSYSYLREYANSFEEVYFSLADEYSKKVFVNVLNAKISGNFDYYRTIQTTCEYFDDDIIQLGSEEVYMDIGSFGGNAIIEFARRTQGEYAGIIAVEPDKRNRQVLQERLTKNRLYGVEVIEYGVWNKREVLYFHNGREGGSRISEEATTGFGGYSLDVDTVDNLLLGRRVSYISMDIEGAERRALLGAGGTIRRWKPKLAVSVYHRREDLFDIPILVLSLNPAYRLYLRHYTDNQTETVLYAI